MADDGGISPLKTDSYGQRNLTPVASRHRYEGRLLPRLHIFACPGNLSSEGRDEFAQGDELSEGNRHVLGIACLLVDTRTRLPQSQPVLHALTLVQIRITDENRRVQGCCCLIDELPNAREGDRIPINRTLAPQCDVDGIGDNRRIGSELTRCAHIVHRYFSRVTVCLRTWQRYISLDDADAQHAFLSHIRQGYRARRRDTDKHKEGKGRT